MRLEMSKYGEGHVYRRGRYWWMKYSVDGVAQFESTKTQDEDKAREKLRRRLADIHSGISGGGRLDRIRVNELLDDLLVDYELNNPKSVEDFARPFVKN